MNIRWRDRTAVYRCHPCTVHTITLWIIIWPTCRWPIHLFSVLGQLAARRCYGFGSMNMTTLCWRRKIWCLLPLALAADIFGGFWFCFALFHQYWTCANNSSIIVSMNIVDSRCLSRPCIFFSSVCPVIGPAGWICAGSANIWTSRADCESVERQVSIDWPWIVLWSATEQQGIYVCFSFSVCAHSAAHRRHNNFLWVCVWLEIVGSSAQ